MQRSIVAKHGAATRPYRSQAAMHQFDKAIQLSQPLVRRNRPERAIGQTDLTEYHGLIVDTKFFSKEYEVRNAAFSYAQDVFTELLHNMHSKPDSNSQDINIPESRKQMRQEMHHSYSKKNLRTSKDDLDNVRVEIPLFERRLQSRRENSTKFSLTSQCT
jgi:hypothetical protein